jgi:predicted phosphodiesterase
VKIGVLADIHGNVSALQAVLADAGAFDVDQWWALGDLVLLGPDPVEVVETLRDLPQVGFVRGNTDRYVAQGPDAVVQAVGGGGLRVADQQRHLLVNSVEWTHRALAESGLLGWLESLPSCLRVETSGGTRLLGVHASLYADDGPGIDTDIADRDLQHLLAGCDADVVVGGHTHVATDRDLAGVRALNPGSAGLPRRSNGAGWLLISDDGEALTVRQRVVPFNTESVVSRLDSQHHPARDFVESVLTGRHRYAH